MQDLIFWVFVTNCLFLLEKIIEVLVVEVTCRIKRELTVGMQLGFCSCDYI